MSNQVYVLLRVDYLDKDDSEGREVLLSIHADSAGAKAALDKHITLHNAHIDIKNPNTKQSTYSDELAGSLVIVGQDDYHSYDIRVVAEELHGGTVNVSGGTKSANLPGKKVEVDHAVDTDVHFIPSGKSTALAGKKILVTGTLDGLTRDQTQALITDNGGQVSKALSNKPDLVVIGLRAGPKKVEEINENGTPTTDQKGLFAMILNGRANGAARTAPPAKKGGKRAKEEVEEDEEEEEEEQPKPKKKAGGRKAKK